MAAVVLWQHESDGTGVRAHATEALRAGVTQLVECQPSKLNVASSSLVSRSRDLAYIAQSVEHFLGKEEVTSSSLVVGFLFPWQGGPVRLRHSNAQDRRAVAPIGRATVSKTVCWGFESLLPCLGASTEHGRGGILRRS